MFFGARLRDPNTEWVKFKFSVSRTALATEKVRRLTGDPENFLLQAGLARFRRFLLEDDTPGREGEFMLHSRSSDDEFEMTNGAELHFEASRVQREVLEVLWTNRLSGVRRTDRHDLQAKVCTIDSILHSTLATLETRKLIRGAHGNSRIKILPDGEVELDRLRSIPLPTPAPATAALEATEYDVFISHASEDKDKLVRPLAHALKAASIKVWYDETELAWGMSLRASIDRGLAKSRFGLVILSHSFFAKEWPQRELNALFAMMSGGHTRILPVWHDLNADELAKYSPMTADLLAVKSSEGIDAIVAKVVTACRK